MPEVWVPASVVLGFQLTAFSWRISRELRLWTRGMPPADLLNLASILVIVLGVFVLPTLDLPRSDEFARDAFGLGLLLLGAYPFALTAHYGLFAMGYRVRPNVQEWRSPSEMLIVAAAAVSMVVFIVLAVR